MSIQPGSRLPVFQVLATSFSVFIAHFFWLFILAFVAFSPFLVIELLTPPLQLSPGGTHLPRDAVQSLRSSLPELSPWVAVPVVLMAFLLSWAVSAAMTWIVVAQLRVRRFSLGEALQNGLRALGPMLGLGVVLFFFLLLGLVAFMIWYAVVAGFSADPKNSPLGLAGIPILVVLYMIVIVRYCLVVPAITVERAGVFDSMSRSAQLTKGNRWRIFWVYFVVGLIAFVVDRLSSPISLKLFELPPDRSPGQIIAEHVLTVAWAVVFCTVTAVIYYYRREALEGGLQAGQSAVPIA